MPTLLKIDSSADGMRSRTRRLTEEFARAWSARGEDYTVVSRDLHLDPLPRLQSSDQHWPERLRRGSGVDAELDRLQEAVIDELLAADAVVVGAPMYNYAVPAALKAWIDLVHVPGLTVPFDLPTQPLAGRPFVVAGARGGTDEDGAFQHLLAPLGLVFGSGFGMEVQVVTTSRTLADRVPELDAELAAGELIRAIEASRELGARV
ncbi:FMN-dependent NADH-azoreductase [Leucobacter sp.]